MTIAKKLKILFITSEVVPFIKTGGLADVSSALPQKLLEMGHTIRLVVPKYGAIDERKFKIHEVVRLKDLPIKIGHKEVVYALRSSFLVGPKARVQIYFLDNAEYFGSRHSLYADPITGEDFSDNDERFILLARSVFELINKLGWVPDVIHCNDWQCGLVPIYMKTLYKNDPIISQVKSLFTVHNFGFQGIFPKSTFAKTGLPDELNSENGILHNGKVNFLKSGLLYADAINTVSETYAKEICSNEEFSEGLQKVLSPRKKDIYGIVNGIDDQIWNPEKDKIIEKKYSSKNVEVKEENKIALAEKFGFEYRENVPVIAMISKIHDSKGFDLVKESFKELMKLDIQLVLLGTGDRKYHKFFEDASVKFKNKFTCFLGFDDALAHFIEAGADMLLMPSRYEPCGLNQLYSLVYGTVPIVRETGGLADTVQRFDDKNQNGNGFVFKKYTSEEMMKEIKRAVEIYKDDKKTWTKIMKNGMKSDFSWLNSAKNYVDLYKKITS
ncbi:MAG: glycogen synthase GlgA [bacterium]